MSRTNRWRRWQLFCAVMALPSVVGARTQATPAYNSLEIDVNIQTGDVTLVGNSVTRFTGIEIQSASGSLVGSAASANSTLPLLLNATNYDLQYGHLGGITFNGSLDLGDIYNTGLHSQDLILNYGQNGATFINQFVEYTGIIVSGSGSAVWSGGTGNWSDASKWQAGIVPNDPSLIVAIDNNNPNASFVTLDQNASIASLSLDSNDTLSINSGNTLTFSSTATSSLYGTLNNNGTVAVNSGKVALYGGGGGSGNFWVASGASLQLGAGVFNLNSLATWGQGTIGQTGGILNANAGEVIANGATFSLSGETAVHNVSGSLYVGGDASGAGGAGVLNVQNGAFNVGGSLKVWDTVGTALNLSGGILTVSAMDLSGNPSRLNWTAGTLQLTGSGSFSSAQVPKGGTLWIQPTNSSTQVMGPSGGLTVNGELVLDSANGPYNTEYDGNINVYTGGIEYRAGAGGSRTIVGNVVCANDIEPGTSTASLLTVSSLNMQSLGSLSFNLGSPGVCDQITVQNAGGLSLDQTLFRFNSSGGLSPGIYPLIQYNQSFVGSWGKLYGPTNFTYALSTTATPGWIDLLVSNATSTGGPSTSAIWAGGAGHWSDSTKWQSGIVPNSPAVSVSIDQGNPVESAVTLDQNATIASLALDPNDSLTISPGDTLTFASNTTSTLSGVLNNNGAIVIQSGKVRLYGGGNDAGTFTVFNGASLEFDGGTHNLSTLANWGPGSVSVLGGIMNANGGEAITSGGTFTLSGASTLHTVSGTAYVGGDSSGAGGAGTLTIQSGTMTVAGTLKVWNTTNTAVNLSGGTLATDALDLSGGLSHFAWTGGTLQMTASNTFPLTQVPEQGTLLLQPRSGSMQMTLNATLTNRGTMSLSSANGAYDVVVSGDVTNNGVLQYGSGAGGARKILGNVVNNGVLTPDNSTSSSLIVNSLTLNAGSRLNFNLGAPGTNNEISVINANGLDIAGTTALNLTSLGSLQYGTYPLLSYNQSYIGSLANFTFNAPPSGFSYALSNDVAHSAIDLLVGGNGTTSIWQGGAGHWSDSTQWQSGIVPNSPTVSVSIDQGNPVASVVTLDTNASVSTLVLDANDTLNISPGNTLTLGAVGGSQLSGTVNNSGTLSIIGGIHTIQGAFAGSGSISANSGTLVFGAASGLTKPLSISGNVTVNSGATITFTAAPVVVTNTIGSLTINGTGTVDLGNHSLLINNANLATIGGYLRSGYGDSSWTGTGLTSSAAAADYYGSAELQVGYVGAADHIKTGPGAALTGSQVLIKPALAGDANLDGVVNFVDFNILAFHYLTTGNDWATGDNTYDANGTVDFTDFDNLAGNYTAPAPPVGKSSLLQSKIVAISPEAKLTSSGVIAKPAYLWGGNPAVGALQLTTGWNNDVDLYGNHATGITGIEIISPSGSLIPSAVTTIGTPFTLILNATPYDIQLGRLGATTINGGWDLGDIFNSNYGFTPPDLTLNYGQNGDTLMNQSVLSYYDLPEPGGALLAALMAGGLRRRRRRTS